MSKHLSLLLAVVLMACSFSACGHDHAGDDHAGHDHAKAADATPGAAVEGKNYFIIDPPLPTSTGNKIEVVEVFSYACVHCASFQPYADQLKQALPAHAQFTYMPAIFNPAWEAYARAFYTAQSLGVLEQTHQKVFDAVHRDRRPMRSFDDIAAFYAENGVDAERFTKASNSFEVESKLARSREYVPKYGVDGTPTLIVNGKYRLTGQSAGGYPQIVDLTQLLVKQEHEANTKGKSK